MTPDSTQAGFSLVELMVSVAIAALLLTGLQQLLAAGMETKAFVESRTELARQSRFAMSRMVDAVHQSERLLLPLTNNPATAFDENVREQTVPASPPQSGSTLATAVLAITLSETQDLDSNGIFDADNDDDGLFDEDLSGDSTMDFASGIIGIDDDGDGEVDEAHTSASPAEDDDDEDGTANEDGWNGLDDDGDGMIDEDQKKDLNGDALPGIGGFDDDGDGDVDEGDKNDDDEDGSINEDWFDPVVFYLQGSGLIERRAVPWDENGDSLLDGRDFVESTIADNVTHLRIERVPLNGGHQLVEITLELTNDEGESISLNTRSRLGSTQ